MNISISHKIKKSSARKCLLFVALRRAVTSPAILNRLRSISYTPSTRFFNTNAPYEFEKEKGSSCAFSFPVPRNGSPLAYKWRQWMGAGKWDVKEDENSMHVRVDMPGVDKEQVKISVEDDTLSVKWKRKKKEHTRNFSGSIELPPRYKINGIKAEMENGMLNIVVPKVMDVFCNKVFQVKIQ